MLYKLNSDRHQWLTVFIIATVYAISNHSSARELGFEQIVYPNNQRQNYPIVLLDLALRTSKKIYVLTPSSYDYEQKRALSDLAISKNLDVSWSMTSTDRESMLLPIRIPIFKGLIGWRIPLINSKHPMLFASSQTPKDTQLFKALMPAYSRC